VRVAINALFWNQPATGSGQYVRRLVAHLASQASDIELLLVTPRGQSLLHRPAGVRAVSSGAAVQHGLQKLAYEQGGFVRAARRAGAALLHIPYFAPPRWPRLPMVVTIHDLIPLLLHGYRGNLLVRAYTAWACHAARKADLVLTDSHAAARDITEHLHLPAERVRVIYLAADEAYHAAATTPEEMMSAARAHLGLPAQYLLYLGGFDRRKQVPELLQAYAHSGLARDLPLVVAGRLPAQDTAFSPDPRPLARSLGLEESVRFTGWVEEADKPALYRGARGLVFPSLYEGFGLPVLESLACGTPAIACRGSSLEEVLGPGGLLVDAGDLEGLAHAMRRLAQDDALRATLAQAGLAHARRFSWDSTARETADAYREVLGG